MAQSDQVMTQVHDAVGELVPFAVLCRKIFVSLVSMQEILFLYEFSPNAIMATLKYVLVDS
jgi:hypothetical protein